MPVEKALDIMAKDVPHALNASCFEALKSVIRDGGENLDVAEMGSGDVTAR
jgi:hypothetical protein